MLTNNLKKEIIHSLICFNLHEIQACLELTYVNKAILLPAISPAPKSQPYLLGFINFAGESVPIIDLAFYLELERTVFYSINMPILLCQQNSKMLGIMIDKIFGLETVPKKSLQMQNNFAETNSLFKANILINKKIFLLLNMEKVFSMPLFQLDEH